MTLEPLNETDQRRIVALGELAYEKREEAIERGESTIVHVTNLEISKRAALNAIRETELREKEAWDSDKRKWEREKDA
jgi:hypothetical protein